MSIADRRYPHLTPIDGRDLPELPHEEAQRVTRCAKDIASRTNTHPWWSTRHGAVFFVLGNDPGKSVEMVRAYDLIRKVRIEINVDEVSNKIQWQRRLTQAQLDKQMESNERRWQHDAAEERAGISEEVRYRSRDQLKHETQKFQMGRRYRPSITVP